MLDKVTKGALRAMSNLGKMKVRGLPRALIIILVLLLLMAIILYVAGCIFIWWVQRMPPLTAIDRLINSMTGMSFIAAIGFLGKALIDDDGNGTPNIWEEGDKSDRSRPEDAKGPGK